MPDAVYALRDSLLRETVAWCASKSPFYRERFGAVAESFRGLEDLPRLPPLLREDAALHHAELVCDPSVPAAVQHTTGTTGTFFQIYRGQAEQSFIWDFFSEQLRGVPPPNPRPLCLNLVNAYHGSLTGMPSHAYVLSVGVYDRAQAVQARGVLERSYHFPGVEERVSTIMGTERMIKALTAYLLADGFDLAKSSVKTVMLFGGHVSPARKRMLSTMWNANIRDRYSLTEMLGGAVECGIGGPWVFDPHVIPEVVHPRTFEPVQEGVGVLLLTALYPFTQQMPLVRYFTGDLVELAAGPDAPGGMQVRLMGRLKRSILDTRGPTVLPLILSAPLYEILETIPDIAISPRFPDLPGGRALELTGDHHYALEHHPAADGQPERITLRLGLRYAPWMFPDRVREMIRGLVERLFETHAELAARCLDGRLQLRVEPCDADAVAPYDSK